MQKKNSNIKIKKIALIVFCISLIVGFFYKVSSKNFVDIQINKDLTKIQLIEDPEFFLRTFNPVNQPQVELKSISNPGQIINYYSHYESPLTPKAWLVGRNNIEYVQTHDQGSQSGYKSISMLLDQKLNVFWVATGKMLGEKDNFYGPYRSNFQKVSRDFLPVSINYKTSPGQLEGSYEQIVNTGNSIRILNQKYVAGDYRYETKAYLKDNVIVLHRDEYQDLTGKFEFRTHTLNESIDLSTIPKGRYRFIVEMDMDPNKDTSIPYIHKDEYIEIN